MLTDRDLAERIRSDLALESGIDVEKIRVDVAGGVVTLSGPVPSLTVMHYAEIRVMGVPGVRAVVNGLSVRPLRP